jgi:hypothetical protein
MALGMNIQVEIHKQERKRLFMTRKCGSKLQKKNNRHPMAIASKAHDINMKHSELARFPIMYVF